MFWADKLLEGRKGKEIVNDSFTPSGIVHMGSLKGPIIHDVLYKALRQRGIEAKFLYGFDDFDPIDGLSPDLIDSHSEYLGVPISIAPSPDGNGSFGDYFAKKMNSLLQELGVEAEIYRTSELYKQGKFDDAIRFVLDNAQAIRDVYGSIYDKTLPQDWFPLQVICPNCGKLGTTKVTAWDQDNVTFSCEENLVKWAKGCQEKGQISPFKGTAKMPWKVEWAAKWWTFGVTIEGAGKDHASAGGSYDVAMRLAKDVFKIPEPLKFGYEFFLVDGKKMSSSKGLGLTGEELLKVIEPRVARFLMIHRDPSQTVEFNPYNKDIIPRLYDDYHKAYEESKSDENLKRAFEFAQIGDQVLPPKVRFSVLAQWVQMPNMEEEIKKVGAGVWARYAKVWVEKYAPESERFLVQIDLPETARNLNVKQKEYLRKVSTFLGTPDIEEFQTKIYETAREIEIQPKDAFSAIYNVLLGKDHGPKAAWLISSLDPEFVKKRFTEI